MPCFKQGVGQAAVEIEPLFVRRAPALRNHPRPGDAEAIVLDAQFGHQLHVVFEAMVVVAGHVARIAVGGVAGPVAEGIPNARLAAILGGRALDLVSGGGRSHQKLAGKAAASMVPAHCGRKKAASAASGDCPPSTMPAVPIPASLTKSRRCIAFLPSETIGER